MAELLTLAVIGLGTYSMRAALGPVTRIVTRRVPQTRIRPFETGGRAVAQDGPAPRDRKSVV